MTKLLHAGFQRLWKDRIFWLALLVMTVGSLVFSYLTYQTSLTHAEDTIYVEDLLFNLFPMIGAVSAIFISLHLGADYDHGTLRNKLIVGHTRSQVYFSNLVVCFTASVIFLTGMLVFSGGAGYFLFQTFLLPWDQLLFLLLCCFLATAAFTTLNLALSAAIPSRAFSVVVSIILFYALLMGAGFLHSALAEAEMTYEYVEITMNGVQFGDMVENPAYVDGFQRTLYEFLYDLLPTGQAVSINNLEFDRCSRWPILSLLVCVVTTWAGWRKFRKKDIK